MADFYFKDVLENEKDRELEKAGMGIQAYKPPAQTQQPFQAPKQGQNPFQAFRTALDAQDPFKAQVKQNVTQTLQNPGGAADLYGGLARENLEKQQQVEAERIRKQGAMAYGGAQTGQLGKQLNSFGQQSMVQRSGLESELAASKAASAEQARNAAINQGIQITGQESQERLTREGFGVQQSEGAAERASREKLGYAGLSQQDRQMAQQASQFTDKLSWDKEALRLGIDAETAGRAWQASESEKERASREKLGFAELSVREKDLSQQGKQFADKLEFDKFAVQGGWTQQEADRAWTAGENEKNRTLTREQAELDKIFARSERMDSQTWEERVQDKKLAAEAAQNDLNRSLETMLSNDRLKAQFALSELDQTFQERMADKSFVNTKELEAMRSQLQETLQARGFTQEQAMQISEQKFQTMVAEKAQVFEAGQADIQRQWQSGERIDSQTWQTSLVGLEQQNAEIMAKLQSTLRLDEAGNAQAFQTSFQQMQNDFTNYREQMGYSREMAMKASTEMFQRSMQQAGFTQEQAMQGSRLAWEAQENDKNRAQQEVMAAAQLAQNDAQFMEELNQRYQFNANDLEIRKQELGVTLENLGIQRDQMKMAMADQRIQSAVSLAALGMEMTDGSEEAMAPFVAQMGSTLQTYFKENNIDVSASDLAKGLTGGSNAMEAPDFNTGKPTVASMQTASEALQEMTNKFNAGTEIQKFQKDLELITGLGASKAFGAEYMNPYIYGQRTTKEREGARMYQGVTKAGLSTEDARKLMESYLGKEWADKSFAKAQELGYA